MANQRLNCKVAATVNVGNILFNDQVNFLDSKKFFLLGSLDDA